MKSLAGHFLIAAPKLLDPNFSKCVVLMVQHGDAGAMGVVMNRPLEVTVRQAAEQVLGAASIADGVLFHGGPCEAMLGVVHQEFSVAETEIAPGLFYTTSKERVEELLDQPAGKMKFVVGYAGWGPGQLETEMESGSWLSGPANPIQVFGPTEKLWQRLNTEASLRRYVPAHMIPDDPRAN